MNDTHNYSPGRGGGGGPMNSTPTYIYYSTYKISNHNTELNSNLINVRYTNLLKSIKHRFPKPESHIKDI